jgi:uncharacterized protein (DUF1499 family)
MTTINGVLNKFMTDYKQDLKVNAAKKIVNLYNSVHVLRAEKAEEHNRVLRESMESALVTLVEDVEFMPAESAFESAAKIISNAIALSDNQQEGSRD